MSRKLFSRPAALRRRRAAWRTPLDVDIPRRRRQIKFGRAWQSEHNGDPRRAQRLDRALHWLCCILVPGLFVLAAWLFCIYRLARWLMNY